MALLVSDAGRAAADQSQIERNSYGKGEKSESFRVTADGEEAKERLDVTVGERQYTAEELQEIGNLSNVIREAGCTVSAARRPDAPGERPQNLALLGVEDPETFAPLSNGTP